eukprot:366225-Chlamydomonas_euryale.AAC.17
MCKRACCCCACGRHALSLWSRWALAARARMVRVRVRVTGSGPVKGMPVLSVARRGSSSGLGAVTKGNKPLHSPAPPLTNPASPRRMVVA